MKKQIIEDDKSTSRKTSQTLTDVTSGNNLDNWAFSRTGVVSKNMEVLRRMLDQLQNDPKISKSGHKTKLCLVLAAALRIPVSVHLHPLLGQDSDEYFRCVLQTLAKNQTSIWQIFHYLKYLMNAVLGEYRICVWPKQENKIAMNRFRCWQNYINHLGTHFNK